MPAKKKGKMHKKKTAKRTQKGRKAAGKSKTGRIFKPSRPTAPRQFVPFTTSTGGAKTFISQPSAIKHHKYGEGIRISGCGIVGTAQQTAGQYTAFSAAHTANDFLVLHPLMFGVIGGRLETEAMRWARYRFTDVALEFQSEQPANTAGQNLVAYYQDPNASYMTVASTTKYRVAESTNYWSYQAWQRSKHSFTKDLDKTFLGWVQDITTGDVDESRIEDRQSTQGCFTFCSSSAPASSGSWGLIIGHYTIEFYDPFLQTGYDPENLKKTGSKPKWKETLHNAIKRAHEERKKSYREADEEPVPYRPISLVRDAPLGPGDPTPDQVTVTSEDQPMKVEVQGPVSVGVTMDSKVYPVSADTPLYVNLKEYGMAPYKLPCDIQAVSTSDDLLVNIYEQSWTPLFVQDFPEFLKSLTAEEKDKMRSLMQDVKKRTLGGEDATKRAGRERPVGRKTDQTPPEKVQPQGQADAVGSTRTGSLVPQKPGGEEPPK
jgi:hypothetical protein